MTREYFMLHMDQDALVNTRLDHIVLGNEGCALQAISPEVVENISFASQLGIKIRYLTPIVPNQYMQRFYQVINTLPQGSKVTFNDWGLLYKCWPLIEKQQIIPVLGRIITRSITDCPWHTKILEAEQRSKEMALSSFIHKSKLGILEKYKIKEIEVNAIDPNALTFYHDHHINVTCYENSRILSVARVCFHAKFYDFSPESVCNCQSCSSECYHIELLQKCSRTTKMFCDATDRDKAYYDNLFVWEILCLKKLERSRKSIMTILLLMENEQNYEIQYYNLYLQ